MACPNPSTYRSRTVAIKLGQFLKLANLIDSGSEAKPLLAAGMVRVNGDVETRRGRQLQDGDVVDRSPLSPRGWSPAR